MLSFKGTTYLNKMRLRLTRKSSVTAWMRRSSLTAWMRKQQSSQRPMEISKYSPLQIITITLIPFLNLESPLKMKARSPKQAKKELL